MILKTVAIRFIPEIYSIQIINYKDAFNMNKKILVTGGAGFIGSSVIKQIINTTDCDVINVDKLSYSGDLESLDSVKESKRYYFEKIDICDETNLKKIFEKHEPDVVMHLAAESHVDKSIKSPFEFIETNIIGTYVLLEQARLYWNKLNNNKKANFKFHHISTDEVYGDLNDKETLFSEESKYDPSSPYSASKASSDHLVRAWHRTYNLPTIVTSCSNNYGPYQFPEKLIPLTITNALNGIEIPIYGNGLQVRDWLYVDDHAEALVLVALNGNNGESYCIGGHNEIKNINVVKSICKALDMHRPSNFKKITKYEELISYVEDRSGHDRRYAINAKKIESELKWKPKENFDSGIKKTVEWYLNNQDWCKRVKNKSNQDFINRDSTS